MRKSILITLLVFLSLVCMGQNSGAIKFLGIPIDGSKSQFSSKLTAKGFIYNHYTGGYQGQFNGETVDVYIHTNHDLVDRVYVAFQYTSEDGIRNDFNRLLNQFYTNGKYQNLYLDNSEISSDERISYEMKVNNRRYQASFSYFDPNRSELEIMNDLFDQFDDIFTPEQISDLKATLKSAVDASESELKEFYDKILTSFQEMVQEQGGYDTVEQEQIFNLLVMFMDRLRSLADGEVWFMIHENYGKYRISLYYDNLHNQAHGEDL